jgi:hypothetical protein
MAQSGYTPIQLYLSTTASAVPLAANLAAGELAINTNDGKLYYKNSAGVVTLLAGAGGAGIAAGSNTQLQFNNSGAFGASANLTWSGTVLSTTGLTATGAILHNTVANNQSYTTTGAGTITISSGTTGTIDGMNIGATTAGTGKFTAITNTGLTSGRVVYSTTGGLETDSANLTFDGTNLTLAGGTANGVAYLNGSKVLTTGSALVFDGTNLGIGASPSFALDITTSAANIRLAPAIGTNNSLTRYVNTGGTFYVGLDNSAGGISGAYNGNMFHTGAYSLVFGTNSLERMRIDSSGNVGIGTSSPSTYGAKLNVASAASTQATIFILNPGQGSAQIGFAASGSNLKLYNAYSDGTLANGKGIDIDLNGNVGIGVTSTTYKLDVKPASLGNTAGNTTLGLNIQTNTGGNNDEFQILWQRKISTTGWSNADLILRRSVDSTANQSTLKFGVDVSGGTFQFDTAGTERMRIDSSGNLLVGQTTVGTQDLNSYSFNVSTGAIAQNHITGTGSGASYTVFAYASTVIGSITQSGTTAVLYNVTSDQRLKENIQDAESASALIDALQVRQFDWKSDNTHQRYGFIAQELVTVAPEAVHQPADPEEMMAVDYSKLVPMLVKEIQSLRKRLTALEST